MYQALYRKYRPQTFSDVVGQKSVTDTLRAQLETGKLSHAYLFTGTRGTGKTSCAKILAKAVNCLEPRDGNPCNRCAACRAIDEGSCMDVLEIDAASNNGVDHVRELRDDAIYSPAEVRYRVYIIDEVHMLSISAFNALLKIIEEPPEHLIFILATTELHKIPATILSRCQRFSFRRISPQDVADRLAYVAQAEQIDLDPQAARVLGRMADGALRDGLSLLDQCASATAGPLTAEDIYRLLGLAGTRQTAALMERIARRDTAAALALFDRLYADGKDLGALMDELCALTRDLLVLKTAPQAGLSMLSGVSSEEEAAGLAALLSTGELIQILSVIQAAAAGFTRGGKNRMDAELCIIRLCQPELSLEPEALNARLTRLEESMASGVLPQPAMPKPAEAEPEAPPVRQEEAQPENTVISEAPPGFWADFVEKLRPELPPPLRGYFISGEKSLVQCSLQDGRLVLQCVNDYVRSTIDKPEILALASQKASVILGAPVTVTAENRQEAAGANEHLKQLLEFSSRHSDIITVKK